MDKIIEKTIRKEIELDTKVKEDIDKLTGQLNLDEIMISPSNQLQDFGQNLIEAVFKKHMTAYVLNGVQFAESVTKKKTPVIVNA